MKKVKTALFIICSFLISHLICCTGMAASAEEYYSIGMAYFDLGKYEEAEKWLNRARQADKTMIASTYNLGRLAYERQRFNEAAMYFEDILKKDPDNILALKAAAYSRIKTGDIETADMHYSRLLELVPESADDGYNHALVLFAMERYQEAEAVLQRYPASLLDNRDVMLLFARSRKAQNKAEAIDSYAEILNISSDPKVRCEYAQVLEYHHLYARSIEEYRKAYSDTSSSSIDPRRCDIRFLIARVLLIADGDSGEGITELEGAVKDGFGDTSRIEELLNYREISAEHIVSIHKIIDDMRRGEAEAGEAVLR